MGRQHIAVCDKCNKTADLDLEISTGVWYLPYRWRDIEKWVFCPTCLPMFEAAIEKLLQCPSDLITSDLSNDHP